MKPFHAIVAGTGFHTPEAIRKKCPDGARLLLRREPLNPHDSNAVAVLLPGWFGATKLGYLKAPLAARLAPRIDAGQRFRARVSSKWAPDDREFPRLSIVIESEN